LFSLAGPPRRAARRTHNGAAHNQARKKPGLPRHDARQARKFNYDFA